VRQAMGEKSGMESEHFETGAAGEEEGVGEGPQRVLGVGCAAPSSGMYVSWREGRAAENVGTGTKEGWRESKRSPREIESENLHKLYNENKAFDKKGRPTTLAFRNSRLIEPLHDVTPAIPIPQK